MMQMDIEGIQYTSREHAAQLARDIVAGHGLPPTTTGSKNRQEVAQPQQEPARQTLYDVMRCIDQDSEAQIDAAQLRIWISILEKRSDVPARLLSWLQQMASAFEQLEEQDSFLSTPVHCAVQESLFEI